MSAARRWKAKRWRGKRQPALYDKGIADPIGQIWSGAMMLEHLGLQEAGAAIVQAIEKALTNGPGTRDIGGTATTSEVGKAIAKAVRG